jgi:flagellar M-ring protein FliF
METGLPIALKELSESITGGQDPAQGEPGLNDNGGAPSYVETTVGNDQVYSKVSREVNMEINETKTYIESEQGVVTALTVSVVINLDEEADDPTEAVRNLVAGAAGISPNAVEVERLPFAETPDVLAAYNAISEQAEQYQLIRLLIIIGAILVVVVLLLIALRTILKALKPEPEPVLIAEGEGVDVVAGDELEELTTPVDTPVMQIQRFIERDAESVAQLLRNWLTDDYR